MQQVIIDCQSSKVVYVELSPMEELRRLQETRQEAERQEAEKQGRLKRQLVKELAELREMRANPEIFTVDDIAGKQAEVDKILLERR